MKKHAPAALRNRAPIAEVLAKELPESGCVLEIASGSGEHAMFFAESFPHLEWQPSDPDEEALASIRAYREEQPLPNMRVPLRIDASDPASWGVQYADAIVCINMIHISPWQATEGLFAGAARILGGRNLPLVTYGPYLEQGVETAPSNIAFDESLRSRNGQWGIRNIEDVDGLAQAHGFGRSARYEMPANNLMLVYRSA